MKIVQVIFDLSSGGAERFVTDLSNELSKSNDVTLLTLMDDKDNPEKRQFYRFDLSENVQYKNLGIKQGGGFSIKVLWKVYKALKNEKPDVVHIHLCESFCILAIILLCYKITFVQTLHIDFKKVESRLGYKILFRSVGKLRKMRWAALSPSNYKDMMAAYPNIIGKCIVNGRSAVIPTAEFNNVKEEIGALKINHESKVFLHVARCSNQKNQKMLVSSFNEFVSRGNNAILLIIGAGFDSELGSEIQSIMGANVHYLGVRKNISDYMLNSNCFCLSSLYEGLPITILEAMLAGVPVVCTPFAGAKDVLTDGRNCIISKDYSKQEFVNALIACLESYDVLKQNAVSDSQSCPYTMRNCADEYLRFYEQNNK